MLQKTQLLLARMIQLSENCKKGQHDGSVINALDALLAGLPPGNDVLKKISDLLSNTNPQIQAKAQLVLEQYYDGDLDDSDDIAKLHQVAILSYNFLFNNIFCKSCRFSMKNFEKQFYKLTYAAVIINYNTGFLNIFAKVII